MERLRSKCQRSNFKEKLIQDTFEKINNQSEHNGKKKYETTNRKNTYWTTSFKSLIKLDKKEQDLVKTAKITYARPSTLSGILTNYKTISQNKESRLNKKGYSKGCGRCGLCGSIKGFENMIENTDHIRTKEGKIFKLKQELCCKDYGIYVAQCHICEDTYTGQTVTSFSERWTSHRYTWNKIINNQYNNKLSKNNKKKKKKRKYKENDEQALHQHYQDNHPNELKKLQNKLTKAYKIILIEKPPKHKLDTAENFWIHKLQSKINVIKSQLNKIQIT